MCMASGGGGRDYSSIKKGSIGQPGGGLFVQGGDRQRFLSVEPARKDVGALFPQGAPQTVRAAGNTPSASPNTLFPKSGDPRVGVFGAKGRTVLGT